VYEVGIEDREIHMRCGEICTLLGCYAACNCDSLPTFRYNLSIPSSRIKKYNSSSSFWISCPLKKGQTGCPETSVRNYHCILSNVSEECRVHQLIRGSLNSNTEFSVEILIIVNRFFLLMVSIRAKHNKVLQ
jgi:hypothetical protein